MKVTGPSFAKSVHNMQAAPIAATVNYALQPVVVFNGDNWSAFSAAFVNYARQQGFYSMLGVEGEQEPEGGADTWRKSMAQATTALSSGWIEHKVLNVFKYSTFDNANIIWKRLTAHYSNVTDIRQLTLRDKAERCRQRTDQHLMDWIGVLNSRVAELAASGHDCDDTYQKQLVRHNSNDKFKPVI